MLEAKSSVKGNFKEWADHGTQMWLQGYWNEKKLA